VDALTRWIESLVQWLAGGLQPMVESGNLGYLLPFLMLVVATVVAVTSKNRMSLAGYVLGWVIALSVMALYLQSGGDRVIENLTGTVPRNDMLTPGLFGLAVGFIGLFPFVRMKLSDAQPIIVALVAGVALLLLFMAWRASASIPNPSTSGLEDLIIYRRRYVGIFALTFGIGVLAHVLVSAANPPKPPPAPEKK
jgi:hypothetical protein